MAAHYLPVPAVQLAAILGYVHAPLLPAYLDGFCWF